MEKIIQNFSLKSKNTFGINCIAENYFSLENIENLKNIDFSKFEKIFILGGGSNIVLPQNYEGLIIENNIKGFEILEDNPAFSLVKVGAGENWDNFIKILLKNKIYGLENLALIPGKVGAAPIQNIGAYGLEQEKYFEKADIYDFKLDKLYTIHKNECNFGYRDSIFKNELKNRIIILYVYYKFSKKWIPNIDYADIIKAISENTNIEINPYNIYELVCQIRKRKLPDPLITANAGSFFKNPIIDDVSYNKLISEYPDLTGFKVQNGYKLSAAKLIDKAGWKGKKLIEKSKALVSSNHSLVIIGESGVNQREILELSQAIIDDILNKYNVALEREVNIIY